MLLEWTEMIIGEVLERKWYLNNALEKSSNLPAVMSVDAFQAGESV